MPLRLYNTLTRKEEDFAPLRPPKVGMYVCGVTVYDRCHVGHARAAITFDVIYRYLAWKGFQVRYVRNFTDVDDKIIKRANDLGISSEQVAEDNIRFFYEDMGPLNLKPPTDEPRATAHMAEILAIIEKLLAKGLAYVSQGDVFYAVEKFGGYGKLSGKSLESLP